MGFWLVVCLVIEGGFLKGRGLRSQGYNSWHKFQLVIGFGSLVIFGWFLGYFWLCNQEKGAP